MQDSNIFGCKILRESILLVLNFTLHTHTPVYKYSKYPWVVHIASHKLLVTIWVFFILIPAYGRGITVAFCPKDFTAEVEPHGFGGFPRVNWPLPKFDGVPEQPDPKIDSTRQPGDLFSYGTHVIVYTAEDKLGNKATCKFTVHVVRK